MTEQAPGIVLCRSSPSCSASLCFPGVSWVSNSDSPLPKCTQRRRALHDRLAGGQTILIDADVVVRHSWTRAFTSPAGHRGNLDSGRAELQVHGARDGRAVLRLDEKHTRMFCRGLGRFRRLRCHGGGRQAATRTPVSSRRYVFNMSDSPLRHILAETVPKPASKASSRRRAPVAASSVSTRPPSARANSTSAVSGDDRDAATPRNRPDVGAKPGRLVALDVSQSGVRARTTAGSSASARARRTRARAAAIQLARLVARPFACRAAPLPPPALPPEPAHRPAAARSRA